jgi:hypothetical protein
MHATTYGTLELRIHNAGILIRGPKRHLGAFKKYLESRGIGATPRREPGADTICLEIQPGPSPERVERLLDRWTE